MPKKNKNPMIIHPGEILRVEFMEPLGISSYKLARALHVSVPRINDIVLERRAITADTALRLSQYFRTTAEFWMNLQASYELRLAQSNLDPATIIPHAKKGKAAGRA